jgi:hypothetical protein
VGEVTGVQLQAGLPMEKSSSESTQEFFDLWVKTYQATLGRLVEMPAVGPAREKSEKMMMNFSQFANLSTAWMESNSHLQTVFTEAMQKVQEKAAATMEGDLSPERFKDFYRIWMDTYSETFHEFLKSGHFASDLGKFMSRLMEFKKLNREVLEENFLIPMNLPTKTDINEINKELYSLRKTVKKLSSQVRVLSTKQ